MSRRVPSSKLAITLHPEVHGRIVVAACEDGLSVSAWLINAAGQALLIRDGLRAVIEWEAENGAFTDAELAGGRQQATREVVPHRAAS